MFQSQKAIAAKLTAPLVLLAGCVDAQTGSMTVSQHLWSFLLFDIPSGGLALWLILVPVELEAVPGQNFVTVVNYWKRTRIAHDDVGFVQRKISIFDRLQLKNGKKYLYITCEANEHLLRPTSLDRI
jgi:hypothetical protein